MPEACAVHVLSAPARDGDGFGQTGIAHPLHFVVGCRYLATAMAFSQWRSIRSGSVSMPCSN